MLCACGLRMQTSTVADLLYAFGSAPGASGLRQVLRDYGPNVRAWYCSDCEIWAAIP